LFLRRLEEGAVARRARKLPIARSGQPNLTITAGDWQRIESAYGHQLSDGVRAGVVEATIEFVSWEIFERTAEPVADSQKWIRSFEEAAGDFQNAMLAGNSDASNYAKFLICKYFEDPRLSGKPDPLYSLSGVLTSFRIACKNALRELEPPVSTSGLLGDFGSLPSFKEGEAWDQWIRRLTEIVKVHRLPWRVRKDAGNISRSDQQSPFTRFVRELQKCVQVCVPECKAPYAESALPTAIGQARRKSLRLSSAIRSAKSGSKRPRARPE
jgi:hypothetical protein